MNVLSQTSRVRALGRRFAVLVISLFACLNSMQAQTTVTTFNHYKGMYRDALETNKYGNYNQQAVHEDWNVVYAKSGDINLTRRGDTYQCYVRWFDYSNDRTLNGLTPTNTVNSNVALYNGNYGLIKVTTSGHNVTDYNAKYTYDGSSHVYIGCDQSSYNDFNKGTTFREPTLSQRIVYDIRPASEMAALVDATTAADAWLEEYDMIAPTGATLYIGPKYGFLSSAAFPNYFYGETNPTAMTTNGNWRWNSSSINTSTTSSGQFIQVSVGSNTGDQTYELTYVESGKTYHIAKFTVHVMDREKVGPYAITDTSCLTGTKVLAKQDFNFNTIPGSLSSDKTNAVRYIKPLAVEESTFGFFYSAANHASSATAGFPFYAEYSFVNNGNGWKNTTSNSNQTFANHKATTANFYGTDATSGYALYADGSEKPGTVFSLNFTADLCPGAIMYFSTMVGELSGTTHAILDFIVVGVNKNGNTTTETELATFSTGELSDCTSGWRRILFPLTFNSQVDYDSYRLRVVNKAKNTSGNDFFIDDVFIYLMPAPITPIQASTANECLNENSPLVLYTRIDYAQLAEGSTIYYRWLDNDGNTIQTKYYGASDANATYGTLPRPSSYTTAPSGYTVENSFKDFDTHNHLRTAENGSAIAFIKESKLPQTTDKNTERYVLYVATPITVNKGAKYTCIIAGSVDELNNLESQCSNSADITISNGMRINSEAIGGMVMGLLQEACAHYSYDLSLVIEYVVYDETQKTTVNKTSPYIAHWLFGTAEMVNEQPALYGASFDAIKEALEHYNLYKLDANYTDYTEADAQLITRLVQKGLLVLAETLSDIDPKYNVMPLAGENTLSYTAFPVRKIATDAPDCQEPQSITLYFPTDPELNRNVVTFVKAYDEQIPAFVTSRPRRTRVPYLNEDGSRYTQQNVKILLSDPSNQYKAISLTLFATDDSSMTIGATDILTYDVKQNNSTVTTFTGSNLSVDFSGLDALKAGHQYTFKFTYKLIAPQDAINAACKDDNGNLHDGEAFITFMVIPEVLTLTALDAASWNDDYSWDAQLAPLPQTNVIISKGNHVVLDPVVVNAQKDIQEAGVSRAVDVNALPFITYDINYEPYACSKIFVNAGVALLGQTNIQARKEWSFDLALKPRTWEMTSLPLQGIVSGDIYVPAAGESDDVFANRTISQTPGTYAADRVEYSFYNSLYNKSAVNVDVDKNYDITSSTWTLATNSLVTPFGPGYGWALGFDNDADDKVMRLPKHDEGYIYFRNDTWLGFTEPITRENEGKPAFTPNNEGYMEITLENNATSKVFLLGNPTFAYLDLQALKDANSQLTGTFYLSGIGGQEGRYNHITAQAGNDWLTSSDQYNEHLLAPTKAVLVEIKDAANQLTLQVNKSMLRTADGKVLEDYLPSTEPEVSPAPQAPQKAIFMAAQAASFTSYAAIYQREEASNQALENEDAEVFLLDAPKTPFAIYTIADQKALAINCINDLDIIPLAMYAQQNILSEKVTFSGNEAYLNEWDIVDSRTDKRVQLTNGLTTNLMMNEQGAIRYYLEHARKVVESIDNSNNDANPAIYSFVQNGQLTVFSEDDMVNLMLYDAAGHLISAQQNAGHVAQFNLPTGVYVVRANGDVIKAIVK